MERAAVPNPMIISKARADNLNKTCLLSQTCLFLSDHKSSLDYC